MFEAGRDDGGVFRHLSEQAITGVERDAMVFFLGHHFFSEAPQKQVTPPWTLAYFQIVHQRLLKSSRPDIAGKLRDPDTDAGEALVQYANDAMTFAQQVKPTPEEVEEIFIRAAHFYAGVVAAQLFERGNEYWDRTMVDLLIRSCGFEPGTLFEISSRELDWQVLAVILLHNPRPLAETLIRGFLEKRKLYRDAGREES